MTQIYGFADVAVEQLAWASLKPVCFAVLVLLSIRTFRVRSAAREHACWALVLIAMLVLPFAVAILPAIAVPVPVSVSSKPAEQSADTVTRREQIVINYSDTGVFIARQDVSRAPVERRWPLAIFGVYLAGVFAFALRLVAGVIGVDRLVGRGSPIRDAEVLAALEQLAAKQSVGYPLPRLYETAKVSAPVLVGGDGKSILLPMAWRHWESPKLRAVLAHEMAHVRRGDWWWVLLASVSKCLFWFHPLAWWLENKLAVLAEQCCDDEAVRCTGDAAEYAGVLLQIATAAGPNRVALSALSMNGSGSMTRRIHRVLDAGRFASGVLNRKAWVVMAACALPVVMGIAAAQTGTPPSPRSAGIGEDIARHWIWQTEAFKTTAQEARRLEEQVASKPDDLGARARLLGYYLYNIMHEDWLKHARWVVEHHPESDLAGSEVVLSWGPGSNDAQLTQLWRSQAERHPYNPRVLGNAARHLSMSDAPTAGRLLRRALEMEPKNAQWIRALSMMYSRVLLFEFMLENGAPPPGAMQLPSPAYVAEVKSQMESSTDPNLLGPVGAFLASTRGGRPDVNQRILSYAERLLRRAQELDPNNADWASALSRLGQSPPPRLRENTPASASANGFLIQGPMPEYPALARQARIQGTVRVRVTIGPDGHVSNIVLRSGHPLLVPAAVEAVKTWVYDPAVLKGQPSIETDVDVPFTLPQ